MSQPADHLVESLEHLSRKAGVVATFVLERSSGAILKSTGSLPPNVNSPVVKDQIEDTKDSQDIEGVAAMVWEFVQTAGPLVTTLDQTVGEYIRQDSTDCIQDELKLLRLRTRRYELVIVPDAKYILTAVHETPSTASRPT
jgi:dynein light chain roadblock-type